MNYQKIHDNLVDHCSRISPRDRLFARNPFDYRLENDDLYTENHHILPKSLGGNDENSNLISLLPEEHLFIHMLRYKIYRRREDMLAIRFMLNGYNNLESRRRNLKILLNKKIRMGYSWMRSHAQDLRKNEGWHTPDGIKSISESRKGTMPARDTDTGEIIGSVSINHPNVLSGKWVHHSKGRKQSQEEIEYKRNIYQGQSNPNASGLSEEYFIEKGLEAFTSFGYILSWRAMLKLSEKEGFQWIKSLKSRFGGFGTKGYYERMEQITGSKYDSHFARNNKLC